MLVLEGHIGLHRTVQLQLLFITGWGIDLEYCDIEWFALEMNRDHSVISEIAFNMTIIQVYAPTSNTEELNLNGSMKTYMTF